MKLHARFKQAVFISGENREKLVTWGYVMSCRCLAASSRVSHKLSLLSEVECSR